MLVLAILAIWAQVAAQTRTITGRVTDEQGKGVPNASITVKGASVGVTTNAEGYFTLNAPTTARALVISSVGYQNQEVAVSNQNTVNVGLRTSTSDLDAVVVTGYTRERRSQFAGAASVIGSKAIETVPVGSFDQALQGRAAGLLVNSGSGQPGATAQVRIRGVQSIQGANVQPLYVIDGIPTTPADFESVTILKDANAAALYGARGGTGVIVVTTKKGRAGVTSYQVRSQYGFTQAPDFSRLNMMNTAEILQYEEMMGVAGAGTNTPGWVYSPRNPANASLSPAALARNAAILDSIRGINTNFADLFYRQGTSQSHEINMSGGSDRTRFFISAGIFDQQGIDLNSALQRYTTRFNIDHTANKLTVQLNTLIGFSKTNYAEGDWVGNSPRNPFQMTFRAKPYENPFRPDGSLNFGPNTTLRLTQVANLLEGIQNTSYQQNQIKLNGGLTLGYRVLPHVMIKNTLGVDMGSDMWQRYVNANSFYGSLQQFQSGENREAARVTTQLINTTSAMYSNKFNNVHEVEVGAFFEVVRAYQRGLGFTQFNLDPRLPGSGQGAGPLPTNNATTFPQNLSSARSGFGIRSYFATARYTFADRYTLNDNIRRDRTSRIVNPENREILTWSAGLTWNAMKEQFMRNQSLLTNLQVRATYGVVPNIGSIANFTYGVGGGLFTIPNWQGPQVPSFGAANYAGSTVSAIVPTSPGNPNYRIERVQKSNLGADLAVWQNRARLSVDAYYNRTIDLFVRQPLSATTGFASLDVNAGVMTNRGIEFTTGVDVVRNRDITVSLGLNHAINVNNIEDLGAVNEYFLGTFIIKEGLPYGTHYTFNYLGADPATGRPRFETLDGKETLDPAQAGQFYKFGTFLPKHVGRLTAELRYKGFSIDALFSYQFDVVRSNNSRNWITRGTPGFQASVNGSRELLTQQWMRPGDVAFFQSPLFDRGFTSSDLQDAKFLRFRNLNIAYTIPQIRYKGNPLLKNTRFYVQVQNLAIWSPWAGLDPEDDNNISLNEFPNPRMMVAGIDIGF